MTPTRPVLRYHGGKWKLAPWIIAHFPAHNIYVEPFGGAANVLLRKLPVYQDVYNDLDGEIVNVFQVLRDEQMSQQLCQVLFFTPFSRAEYDLSFKESSTPVERARRTIVRSFLGFGSASVTCQYKSGFRGRRVDSKSPAFEWSTYPEMLQKSIERMRTVTIENRCALQVIQSYDSDKTLFYVDPPYVMETRNTNGDGYRFELSAEDHVALADALHAVRGMVVLSGYDSPLYKKLFHGWRVVRRKTSAASNADRIECLWLSPRVSISAQKSLMEGI